MKRRLLATLTSPPRRRRALARDCGPRPGRLRGADPEPQRAAADVLVRDRRLLAPAHRGSLQPGPRPRPDPGGHAALPRALRRSRRPDPHRRRHAPARRPGRRQPRRLRAREVAPEPPRQRRARLGGPGVPIATTSQDARTPSRSPGCGARSSRRSASSPPAAWAAAGAWACSPTAATASTATAATPPIASPSSLRSSATPSGSPTTSRPPASFGLRPAGIRGLDASPDDDVRSVTFVMLRWLTEESRQRRLRADRLTLEYGAYVSYRWQDRDVPADYLPVDAGPDAPDGPAATMARGYRALALDGWARFASPWVRLEVEAALSSPSSSRRRVIPGVLLREPVRSRQLGAALQSEFGPCDGRLLGWPRRRLRERRPRAGLRRLRERHRRRPARRRPRRHAGRPAARRPRRQLPLPPRLPHRSHPLPRDPRHRDRRLYLRPHARYALFAFAPGQLRAQLAGVSSFVVEPTRRRAARRRSASRSTRPCAT